jgi:hypothetical protein
VPYLAPQVVQIITIHHSRTLPSTRLDAPPTNFFARSPPEYHHSERLFIGAESRHLPAPLNLIQFLPESDSAYAVDSASAFDLVFNAVILSEAKDLAVDSSVELTKRSAPLDLTRNQQEKGCPTPAVAFGHRWERKKQTPKAIAVAVAVAVAVAFAFDLVLNAVILSKAKDLAVDSSVELTKRSAALDLPTVNKKSPGAPFCRSLTAKGWKEELSSTSR